MFRTFNMGVGFVLVVGARDVPVVLATLKRNRERAYVIGEIVRAGRGARPAVVLE